MTNLHSVSDSQLLDGIKSLAREERRVTVEILWHLREVERRRLFAQIGYPSLFEYATRELGYSESAAFRRVSAMRALKETPELEEAMRSGALSVTTVSRVQTFLRAEKLKNRKTYNSDERKSLFENMAGRSKQEVERKLAELSPASTIPRERERVLSDTKTEIRFVADSRLLTKLKLLRSLCSHGLKDPDSYAELLELMADRLIKILDPCQRQTRPERSVALAEVDAHPSRYIAKGLRRNVWKSAGGRCTYQDPGSGRKCSATFKLQIEHITPYAKGGSSKDSANLTLLCTAHQQLSAIREFGHLTMARYVKDLKG